MSIEPAAVGAPGAYSFTVTGQGWTPQRSTSSRAPLPSELAADIDPDTCDTSDFTPVAPRDGSFSVVLNLDIGEDSVAIGAGDTARTQFAAAVFFGRFVPPEPVLAETGASAFVIASVGAALVALGIAALSWSRRRPAGAM
ncbi:MAG: hypothetical protein OEO77_08515 [Acidimicrobiia bacterium]|nr:hypothetical protein [Acidimicrobiia bacterium]